MAAVDGKINEPHVIHDACCLHLFPSSFDYVLLRPSVFRDNGCKKTHKSVYDGEGAASVPRPYLNNIFVPCAHPCAFHSSRECAWRTRPSAPRMPAWSWNAYTARFAAKSTVFFFGWHGSMYVDTLQKMEVVPSWVVMLDDIHPERAEAVLSLWTRSVGVESIAPSITADKRKGRLHACVRRKTRTAKTTQGKCEANKRRC